MGLQVRDGVLAVDALAVGMAIVVVGEGSCVMEEVWVGVGRVEIVRVGQAVGVKVIVGATVGATVPEALSAPPGEALGREEAEKVAVEHARTVPVAWPRGERVPTPGWLEMVAERERESVGGIVRVRVEEGLLVGVRVGVREVVRVVERL